MAEPRHKREARQQLNAERAARGLRPVKRGNKIASPLPRRTVDRDGYAEYIRSEAWQEVRRRFWASKLPKECYCCGREDGPMDLHHRTYKNLGNERLMDLVPLCRDCHLTVHEMVRRRYGRTAHLWGMTNILRRERHPLYGTAAKKARKALDPRRAPRNPKPKTRT
jgi:5-methylcytosine-specific restriction endonuclease McrA